MLDASALLWRLHLDRVDVGGRFDPLADAWATRTTQRTVVRVQRPARRDGAGRRRANRRGQSSHRPVVGVRRRRPADLERPHDRRRRPARQPRRARPRRGPPRRRRRRTDADPHDPRTLRRLARPARRTAAHTRRLGHPQWPTRLARSLVDERLAVRETSVWSWQRRSQVLTASGDTVAADRANQQAAAHAARFTAAAAEPTSPIAD